jgi:hypothetical protein
MTNTRNTPDATPEPQEIDPNRLLDALAAKMRLENDAALAHKLQVIQPIVRMLREGKLTMSSQMLLGWLHEATGIPVDEMRAWMRR